TGTGIGGEDQLVPGRIPRYGFGASKDDLAALERLAERIEHLCRKLGCLIQEEHAPVRQGDDTGSGEGGAATNQSRNRGRVVRGLERRTADEPSVRGQGAGDRVDRRDLEGDLIG